MTGSTSGGRIPGTTLLKIARVLFNEHVLTTVVQVNNRRGTVYSAIVRRVHPAVVRTMLARAAQVMARPTG